MKPELITIVNRLFDDEDFVRSLYDARGKKDRLDFCLERLRNFGRLGQRIRGIKGGE